MVKLPIDAAEKLYDRYASTRMDPKPMDEIMPIKDGACEIEDRVRWAFEKGIVSVEDQLSWIYNLHVATADLEENYDVAVLNALRLTMYVVTGVDREFEAKPESFKDKVAYVSKMHKTLKTKSANAREAHKDEVDKLKAEIEKLNGAVKVLKEAVEDAKKSAKKK